MPVLKNKGIKMLQNFQIYIDRATESRRPDIAVVDKQNPEAVIIDIVVLEAIRLKDICRVGNDSQIPGFVIRNKQNIKTTVIGAIGAKDKLIEWLAFLSTTLNSLVGICAYF